MAKFIFKMESLLSIKYKLEDQAKAEYGMELIRFRRRLTDAVQDELDLLEIKKLENCVEHAKYNINVQKFVISQQQQRVDRAREKLDNAMKERKTYEK